ncbi:type II toxin-antitoxin system ParD family antitoxin [Vibrio quintilis]|uniref:Antitoxin ParD n=1 Tax=Vibrio quintilis TaxID=1117707 RepID=A0A1M7YXM8_9VIBR|nr:type II toxin-antitoxin system ParD family antitoxin [Vibrio quintilis]SHO57293.1 Antitoxin ParD1 [Vibrio quintilis]
MNVNLSSVFEDYIRQQLDTGMYNNASEVIREALRLKMQQDEVYQAKLIALRSAANAGLESGEPAPFDVEDLLCEARKRADV